MTPTDTVTVATRERPVTGESSPSATIRASQAVSVSPTRPEHSEQSLQKFVERVPTARDVKATHLVTAQDVDRVQDWREP